jgi:hypothetical protein
MRRRTEPTATSSTPPDHIGLMTAAAIMIAVGVGGLYWLIFASGSLPRIGGELWLFFVLLLVASSGLALPLIRFINVRFTPLHREVPPAGVIVRQSVWVGLWVVMCAWLQIPRLLTLPLALFIAGALLVVEIFLRTREMAAEQED